MLTIIMIIIIIKKWYKKQEKKFHRWTDTLADSVQNFARCFRDNRFTFRWNVITAFAAAVVVVVVVLLLLECFLFILK